MFENRHANFRKQSALLLSIKRTDVEFQSTLGEMTTQIEKQLSEAIRRLSGVVPQSFQFL